MSENLEFAIDIETARHAGEPQSALRDGTNKNLIRQEKKLVDRCVKGDVAAWETLYERHHPALLRSISALLGSNGSDESLVDELAAQVWYRLVDRDGELLGKFSPKRGARLNTFIRAVAKEIMCRHFRSEQRRRRRELVAAEGIRGYHVDDVNFDESLSEFLGTLSESEREFTENYLLSNQSSRGAGTATSRRSDASIWQFSRRIRIRLKRFFRVS